MPKQDATNRRQFLGRTAGGAAWLGACSIVLRPAEATPASLAAAIRHVIGAAELRAGKVSVASPMTPQDHVKSIHVFNEKNPQPNIGNFYLGPQAGRAEVATRIRLADSQKIIVIARLSDDTFWSASADVVVTLAACTEELI